jgi:hypothetical protein
MTPKEKAKELFNKFAFEKTPEGYKMFQTLNESKRCALIAVDYIITSNPHSNPFNTEVYSTMGYWQEVKQEIEQL